MALSALDEPPGGVHLATDGGDDTVTTHTGAMSIRLATVDPSGSSCGIERVGRIGGCV